MDLIQRRPRPRQTFRSSQERSTQGGDLDRGHVPGDMPLLRQIGRALGTGLRTQLCHEVPSQPRLARHRRDQAQSRTQYAGLACPIGAAQGYQLAGPDGQIDIGQHGPRSQPGGDAVQRQQTHDRHSRAARQAIAPNRGAPTKAVNTPSLSS